MDIETTTGIIAPANFLASAILRELGHGRQVLWFVTGGSSISVAVEAAKIISAYPHSSITVTLTDERYGVFDHPDSNWHQLFKKGFSLPNAKLIPILSKREVKNLGETTEKFNTILDLEMSRDSYKIGLFGIGVDGHTAGILPASEAVDAPNWACGYESVKFERITITPKTILGLDEAVVFTQGVEKLQAVADLADDIDIKKQPAQILKKIPLTTIFQS